MHRDTPTGSARHSSERHRLLDALDVAAFFCVNFGSKGRIFPKTQ